jgi:hypothetical protein
MDRILPLVFILAIGWPVLAAAAEPAGQRMPVFGRYHDDLVTVVLYETVNSTCNKLFEVSPQHPEDSWSTAVVTYKGKAAAIYCWHERLNNKFLVCPPVADGWPRCFNVPMALLDLKGGVDTVIISTP